MPFSLFGCCILNLFISKLCSMKLYSEQSPGGTTSNAFLGWEFIATLMKHNRHQVHATKPAVLHHEPLPSSHALFTIWYGLTGQ